VESWRDYDPVQPRGTDWRGILRKLWAPIAVVGGLALKFGAIAAKFGAVFIAFGGYALIWGWKFGLGVVLLIFVHEMGHFLEAMRQRLNPSWPVFIPFLGAYVKHTRGNPWQTTRVAIAGPIVGGLGSLVCLWIGFAIDSRLLEALAYFGFFINLFNMVPIGFLDGGAVWRSTQWLWQGGGRGKATVSAVLYVGTAIFLAYGAYVAYLPQDRL
jgi:Zn-dependent protease